MTRWDVRKATQKYLLEQIDLTGYQDENGNDYIMESMREDEKLAAARRIFESEMGWLIRRLGQNQKRKACSDWLAGLCSAVPIAFTYCDIIELAYETGGLKKNSTEKDEDRICENYFPYMASNLVELFNKQERRANAASMHPDVHEALLNHLGDKGEL